MNADQFWNLLSPILATAARATFTVTMLQTGDQLLLERAARHEVEHILDGFVRDVAVGDWLEKMSRLLLSAMTSRASIGLPVPT